MCQLGGVRCYKSRQQLGHYAHARPLVEGQQPHIVVVFEYHRSTCLYFQRELRIDALGAFAKLVNVGQHLQVGHTYCLPHGDAVHNSLASSNQLTSDSQPQPPPVLGGVVRQFKILQAFAPVDGHSVVYTRKILNLQAFSVDFVDHGFLMISYFVADAFMKRVRLIDFRQRYTLFLIPSSF